MFLHELLEREPGFGKLAPEPFDFTLEGILAVEDVHEPAPYGSRGRRSDDCPAVNHGNGVQRGNKLISALRRNNLERISTQAIPCLR